MAFHKFGSCETNNLKIAKEVKREGKNLLFFIQICFSLMKNELRKQNSTNRYHVSPHQDNIHFLFVMMYHSPKFQTLLNKKKTLNPLNWMTCHLIFLMSGLTATFYLVSSFTYYWSDSGLVTSAKLTDRSIKLIIMKIGFPCQTYDKTAKTPTIKTTLYHDWAEVFRFFIRIMRERIISKGNFNNTL